MTATVTKTPRRARGDLDRTRRRQAPNGPAGQPWLQPVAEPQPAPARLAVPARAKLLLSALCLVLIASAAVAVKEWRKGPVPSTTSSSGRLHWIR